MALLVLCTGAGARGETVLMFHDGNPTVAEATPGGRVALQGVGREQNGFVTFVRRFSQVVEDHDRDGVVEGRADWDAAMPAVWAAADIDAARVVLAVPAGQALVERPERTAVLSEERTITIVGRVVDLMLVQPGEGAWVAAIADGGAGDLDGQQDTVVTVGASSFLAEDGQPPDPLRPGDAVVVVDPDRLHAGLVLIEGRAHQEVR